MLYSMEDDTFSSCKKEKKKRKKNCELVPLLVVWVVQMLAYSILLKIAIMYFMDTCLDFYFKIRYVWKTCGEIFSV